MGRIGVGRDERGAGRWLDSEWRADAEYWIGSNLAARAIGALGPVETERTRFWSIHLSVSTTVGKVWFKENCPQQLFEARLVQRLVEVAPDRVLEIFATEPERGWILSPDHGPTLRSAAALDDPTTWRRLLVDYAVLQRSLIDARVDWPACGLTLLDPARSAAYLAAHVDRLAALGEGDPGRMAPETAQHLRGLLPRVREWGDVLAASGLPLTLEHSDLHANNAFPSPAGRPLRIFDFGDSVVGFPLCSLLVPTTLMRHDEGGPRLPGSVVAAITDAYLEVFSDLAPLAELRTLVPPALMIARLHRHESWRRVLLDADPDGYATFADAPTAWLGQLAMPAPD